MSLHLFEFKKQLKELGEKRARHTELISVYIPPDYELAKVMNQIRQEQGTATNIKSTSTRKNVTGALEKLAQHLRLFKEAPATGLAIFSGNTSEQEGKDNFEVISVIPPQPIKTRVYLCEQKFYLDPLVEMTLPSDVYGLVVLDRGGATVGLLKGTSIDIVQDIKSMVPGKFRAGGQSSVRFARVRENLANDFYKGVGEKVSGIMLQMKDFRGLIIGGAGPSKEEFISGDFLHHELRKKILAVKDVGSDGEPGIHELVERSQDVLSATSITKEKNLVREFLERLATNKPVAYGEVEVRKAIAAKAVQTLLISEKLEKYRVKIKCSSCGNQTEGTVDNVQVFESKLKGQPCPACKTPNLAVAEKRNVIEELAEAAENINAAVELISNDTEEGKQLFQLGGLAALLKFALS